MKQAIIDAAVACWIIVSSAALGGLIVMGLLTDPKLTMFRIGAVLFIFSAGCGVAWLGERIFSPKKEQKS